ncbi:MAG TPA: MMPL family transporter, partial [Candidatus Nanopelagicales bacterium]|nr:MMPL family transporter [Candidatus Nanopelagicales bacterium]
WIVPLLVVGAADQLGGRVTQLISAATGLPVDGSSAGIASVLVFGAGTNYALLLIARYREELRGVRDTREAMRRALRSGGPAIAGSALTVTLALLTLSVAVTGTTRTVGWTSAVGIVVVLLAALLVLPAALVVCGRGVFWPFVPRMGSADPARAGVWSRVGAGVVARPLQVTIGSILLLVVLAAGLIGTRIGLATTEQFRTQSESAAGLETIAAHFPGGEADPVVIVANADRAGQVLRQAQAVPGVSSVTRTDGSATLVRLDAVLAAGPGTPASFESVRGLRAALSGIDGADAVVGGSVAEALDARDAATRDFLVIAPLILLVVALVLVAVLRSLVAPLLIVPTVVLSYLAALGLGSWMSSNVFGFPALDVNVPLFAFLFLVALGVDYNIFLTSRAREESARDGTQRGIVTAVAVTGSVITSAGVLLASVFAVLGVLPLITLTQVGIIVGLGVLLDTFVVRTLLVPALVGLVGRRFWWPREVDPDPLPYRGDRNPPTDLPDLAAPAEVRL